MKVKTRLGEREGRRYERERTQGKAKRMLKEKGKRKKNRPRK